jgi:type VI secretion system protein ImpA
MANVEPIAPVIDIEAMLQPISEENPSGESLQYAGLYDEIREARRADDAMSLGEWQHELKVANFRQVIDLAVSALTAQTKDMQVAAWLAEALTKEHSFAGLRDSLQLMSGLQQNFWETCFPEVDEGDEEGRANAIEFMDRQTALALQEAPITGGTGLSFIAFEESKRFNVPENIDSLDSDQQERYAQLRAEAEQFNRTTGEMWRKAKAQTRRAFYETLHFTLEECWEAYEALNRTIEEKFDPKQMPGLNNLKKSLDNVRATVKNLLQEKRAEEPDPSDAETDGNGVFEGEESFDASGGATGGTSVSGGAVRSRQEALKRLSEVAEFFRKTEPHSPVSYLVQRAVKWGNMPLESWLGEVIKDENVLGQLRETLGVGSYDGSSTDSSESYEESYDSGETSESSSW